MITHEELERRAASLIDTFRQTGLTVATAESCTGGLVSGFLTEVAGSSKVFERGFVTYSNEAKTELLGVPKEVLEEHGAVSEPVARSMAVGAIAASRADVAVSITGIAGPGGGSPGKPVGLVHFGAMKRFGVTAHREMRFGDLGRHQVRLESVAVALELLIETSGCR